MTVPKPRSQSIKIGFDKLGLDEVRVPSTKPKPPSTRRYSRQRKQRNPWVPVFLKLAPLLLLIGGGVYVAGPVYRFLSDPTAVMKIYQTQEQMKQIIDCLQENLNAQRCPQNLPRALQGGIYTHPGNPHNDAWGTPYFLLVHPEENSFTLISGGTNQQIGIQKFLLGFGWDETIFYSELETLNNLQLSSEPDDIVEKFVPFHS